MTCINCQMSGTGENWPHPKLCDKCAPETLACPFCGEWTSIRHLTQHFFGSYVQCDACETRGPVAPDPWTAIKFWNERKPARIPFHEPLT